MKNEITAVGRKVERIEFNKDIESLVQQLESLGLSSRVQKVDGERGKIYIGRKTYDVTLGKNFIRIAKGDKKIQLAYKSKKNTNDKILQRIEELKNQ